MDGFGLKYIMMKKAVILTLERTSRRRFLSGGGLRVLGLRWILQKLGYEVTCLQPSSESDLEPWEQSFRIENIRSDGFIEHNMNEVLKRQNYDLLVVEQWGLLDELESQGCPVIVDLHGSLLFENEVRGYVNPQQMRTKILSLSKCDAIITPGERQYYYYVAWAKMAGILADIPNVLYLPLFLPEDIYTPCREMGRENTLVMGGATWPWADLNFANQIQDYFTDMGFSISSRLYTPEQSCLHPESAKTQVHSDRSISSASSHLELIKEYSRASLAWDFYPVSWERKLAITTRTVEYLYCGLVPIYRKDQELGQLMQELDLGICIDRPQQILEIKDLKSRVAACRQNIFNYFPKCWNEDHHLNIFSELINKIEKGFSKHSSVVVDMERDYRDLRRQIGEVKAERDHLHRELLRLEQELKESRDTKERWKRLWKRDC